jgi:uncharacterized protein YjiS (DUF1127 family)
MARHENSLFFETAGLARHSMVLTVLAGVKAAVGHVYGALIEWRNRARGRAMLGGLDERLLKDIGVNRATASHEAGKRFWES